MSEEEKLLKEAKKLPWEERLHHKNWKVRNEANVDLAALLDGITDPKDPRLREFGLLFKKTVTDSNAPVQEKALDALISFLKAADVDAGRYAKEICDAVVAKCLTGRPKTIEKAQTVFLLWVELEASEVFLEAMEKAVKNKVAKAVVPAIDVMFQAVSEFGTKVVPPKKILKMLSELFDHQDQNVRASAKGLTIELCRWIGKDTVKSILFEKMRDTMKKELDAELANVTGVPKPTRKIRSEQQKEAEIEVTEEVAGVKPAEEDTTSGTPDIDEYDLVDPVDILTPLEKSVFWEGVKATKWSDRRDAVVELTKLASTKKIASGDFSEICRTLKKLMTDVNLAVAVEAVQATGNLARGLRKEFSSYSRMLLSTLLEKLKEKRAVVSDALMQTLQAMHAGGSIALADIVEDIKVASKNKVPSVRSSTLTWVTFCIESSNKATVSKLHKDYVPICMECLNDGTPEVRDAAFSALAAIAKLVGMKPLEKSLDKLDDVRRKKLSDLIGAFENGKTDEKPYGTLRSSHTGGGSSAEGNQSSTMKRSAASMLSGKKPMSLMPTTKKTGQSRQGGTRKADDSKQNKVSVANEAIEDIEPVEMSLEEIEGKLGSLFPGEIITNLKSAVWKERLEAMISLKETVEGLNELEQNAEIVVHLLSALPGWGEKNVQVQQKVLEVVTQIASTVTKFPKRCVVLCILGVAEKVADIKTRIQATQCLTSFCEAVGPSLIFERLCKIMKEHKNPKVLSEGLMWMVTAVEDFGVSHIKLRDLIDFCKEAGLQSSAAATRNATTKLIGILHKFVGPDLKLFFGDVKPTILTAIDAEFEKNPYEGSAAAPKKTIKDAAAAASAVSSGSGAEGLPREDISKKLSPSLISNMSSPDWKVRLESIEGVNKLLEEANNRIQPTGTGELFGALRARLFDSNKNLVMSTLSVIGNIAIAMGPAVDKSSKGALSDVLRCLGDNKKHMRESVLKALDSWVAVVQLDKMVPYIVGVLTEVKLGPDGRKDLFEWVTKQLTKLNDQPDMSQLLKPTSVALMDKSAEVRKAAESALTEIARVSGHDMMVKVMKELQGEALSAVLERYRPMGMNQDFEPVKQAGVITGPRIPGKHSKHNVNSMGERPSSRSAYRSPASKAGQPKFTKQAIPVTAQDYAVQGQPLFNLRDSFKEERERPISRKYKFEEPRVEQIQELESDLLKYFREDLHRRLLSNDFKKHVDGLELLQKAISTHIKEMTELVDVLLRWVVLRFCESNTTCLLKVLEFLPEFFEALKNESYVLTEYEANIFLPCLMEKSGHNIEKVREKMRDLVRLTAGVYPPPKLFNFVLEGLRSKNNRSRIECADHIGDMIDQYGIEVAGPSKALQTVASLTAERDGELRKAALNTLATAYKILGEDIWRFVGKLAEAQKSMLDDRFKWKAREMEKRREGRPGEARAALRRSVRDNGLEATEHSTDFIPRPLPTPSIRVARSHFETVDHQHYSAPIRTMSPASWNDAIDVLSHGSAEQAIEAMRFVSHELIESINGVENQALENMVTNAEILASCLTTKVSKTFNLVLSGASSRLCKYVLNTLMQTFQIRKVANGVKENTLEQLITELLLWLLDERLPLVDDGSQLLKALNVLMLKILENADRTAAFVVLIHLLHPLDPSRWHSPAYGDVNAVRNQKFSDLVVKCLIKLTKVLPNTIFEVDLDVILHSIHRYLQELGLEEIRRRAGADDKPLRMVKTILHELVKIRGTAIKGHLSMVPIDMEPEPIILAYIELNLQTMAAARMLNPAGVGNQQNWGEQTGNGAAPGAHSTDTQLKQELAAIFKKIGDKQTCSSGLHELHRITQMYPQVDIFAQLQNASEAFRTYIRDGLAQIDRSSAAGRMPASVPISTPPPVTSPTQFSFSPNLRPTSPVDDKLHMVRADQNGSNSTTSQGDSEQQDFRSDLQMRLLNSQHDINAMCEGERKLSSASPHGSLDAIRERMKIIQSATGNPVGRSQYMYGNGSQLAAPRATSEIPRHSVDVPNFESSSKPVDVVNFEASRKSTDVPPPKDEGALSLLQARMDRLKSGIN